MPRIRIDNKTFEVDSSKNLLHIALSLGFDLPYFCWHPALGSVGACRQCAVKQFKDENDTRGRIVMACMELPVEGMRISIDDIEAQSFRASVIEWLMTNHPHDCPVCDEGGECHLQDMTVMSGHNYRRFRFPKRTYKNQYLGPFINHEMNRCIQCYRCVRFYKDYAGGRDLDAFGIHNNVYFGRIEDGVLENEFSGNLVEVCPTGVFTDKTLKQHYTRKWDLQSAPSICTHCGLGCNTIAAERYGSLRRILNRYNSQVNGYFLCDRGRFGYEFVNGKKRIWQPRLRVGKEGSTSLPTMDAIRQYLAEAFAKPKRIIGIGSPRASLESNFALKSLVGPERFYTGLSKSEQTLVTSIINILEEGPARTPSLHDMETADAILVLGEDLTNTAPRTALALRQAVRQQPMKKVDALRIPRWHDKAVRDVLQDETGPLFIASPASTKLDDVATRTYRTAPDDIARLGFAIAHVLDKKAPAPPGLDSEALKLAQEVADVLRAAERPLIISGTSLGSEAVIQAAANVAWALCTSGKNAQLSYTVPEANSVGVAMLGGGSVEDAVRAITDGSADTVIILENDLYRRTDADSVNKMFEKAGCAIVLDYLETPTAEKATLVLPSGTFAESDGTFVSNEGRAQRFYQVFFPKDSIKEAWRWITVIMSAADRKEARHWWSLDDVVESMCDSIQRLKGIAEGLPHAEMRLVGMKIPRASRRYSGRTAMFANISVHEPKPPDDPDSPLTFSMEGFSGIPPAPLINMFWSPGWNSVQSVNKFQSEVGGPLLDGDPGVRLFEPRPQSRWEYGSSIPAAYERRSDQLLFVPFYHIFGSEELSADAPAVAERIPQAYVALNSADAKRLKLNSGESTEVTVAGKKFRLTAVIEPSLPEGTAGIPVGLKGLEGITLPAWGRI